MSKSTWIAASAIAAIMTSASFAVTPSSRDTGNLDFGLLEGDLSGWHLAVYGAGATRNLENGDDVIERDLTRVNGVIGYDLTRWITVYGLAGGADLSEDTEWNDDESDTSAVWGVGLWANLIQSEQLPLMDTITSYRLTSGLEYSYAGFDEFGWTQIDGFLTLGFMNELRSSSRIFPAMVEQNQLKDGSIKVPEVRQKYLGGLEVISNKK